MKTKKLFLMAAMLLMSVCMFAQNNTPLKGDVNEDGTVDVADLVSVMQIMKDAGGAVGEKTCYWYAGVNNGNAVTGDNFTNVASRIAESQIPETGSVTASSQYVYIVMPETRHISSLTNANGATVGYDCVDAFGYHIYKTSERVNGTINYATAETIYYWYVGQTQPTVDNYTSLANQVNGYTSPIEYTNTSGVRERSYILIHNSKSIASIIGKVSGGNISFYEDTSINIPNYKVYETAGIATNSTIIITIQ